MRNDAEQYFNHLERLFGEPDVIRRVESTKPGPPSVSTFTYYDYPNPGCMTAVTYGLSLADHPAWINGRAELMVCVESDDESWVFAAAWFAETFRGEKAFSYGDVFTTDAQISKESEMRGFLVFAPPFLSAEEQSIRLPSYTVFLKGMYPIYSGEVELYREVGLEKFWHMDGFAPLDVRRPDLSKAG